jgi:uncharacterized membrane protein YbhN (UPF0104 family)
VAPPASIEGFFDAVGSFFANLAGLQLGPLVLGAALFIGYLSLRARAYFHVLRAAYPGERFEFRRIWGAYMSAYGINNVLPARAGDVMKLYLVKESIPNSHYPAVGAAFFVEAIFDAVMAVFILAFAFSQGVFPKPLDFADLDAFDLSFLASNPRLTLFILTAVAVGALLLFAVLSARVKAFWARVRQGVVIVQDRRRYLREVFALQLMGWLLRFAAMWAFLEAFNIGGSVQNTLLVLGTYAVAAVVPFTPSGAGVQQVLILQVFAGTAVTATVAAYSVGLAIAVGAITLIVGFLALVLIFDIRSFGEAVRRGRTDREAAPA